VVVMMMMADLLFFLFFLAPCAFCASFKRYPFCHEAWKKQHLRLFLDSM
jgi:hypothetical protein